MSAGTKIGVAFALGLVLLAAVGGTAYVSTQHLLEANRQVVHTHEVQNKLEDVLSAHVDAETGQRGFIITGDDRYLAPYNAGISHIRQDIDALADLTRDNASQQESLRQVRTLSDAKLAHLRETIRLRRESGLEAAVQVIRTNRGKKIMDDLRGVVAQMEAHEQALLEERNAVAEASASHATWTVVVWMPLALVVLAIAAVVLMRNVRFGGPATMPSTAGRVWVGLAIRYGSAVIIVAVAVLLRWRLEESFGPLPVFITFYPAVLLVASIGGGGPGILATVLSALAADYWFLPPYGSFRVDAPNDVLALGIFTGANLCLCVLAERLRRARWAEALSVAQQERAEELARQNEELTRQSEELSQQSEELSQQSEELSRQNEELQSQSEEVQTLNDELGHREDLLEALLEAARLGSEKAAMQEICAAALRTFGEAVTSVIVCEQEVQRLMIRAVAGAGKVDAVPDSLPAEHSFAELVIQQNQTASLNDVSLRPDLSILQIPSLGPFQAVLCAPMQRAGRAFGAVTIYSAQRQEWTAEQFRLAEWLAAQCTQMLETLRMQQALARVASFPTLNPNPIVEADPDGRVSYANPAAQRLFPDIERRGADHPWLADWQAVAEACRTGESLSGREVAVDGRIYHQTLHFMPQTGRIRTYGLEITEGKRAQNEREIAIEFLHLINESAGTRDLIQAAATFFQQQSGCEAVGIRMKDGDDYPYFEARGFPAEFLLLENSLCGRDSAGALIRDTEGKPLVECMCGNVIYGRFDPAKPFFTAQGSFWTNGTTELLASTTEADRQGRTRNRCNAAGYESVALLPLGVGEERLGLLQLNDRRKGMFTPAAIGLWERLAGYLAVALAHFRAEDEVRRLNADLERRVAEQTGEIRKAGAYNRILIESSLDPLVTIGPDGKITDVSTATEQATGFGRDDLIGQDFADYFTEPEKARAGYQQVFDKGLVRDYPLEIRHRDGRTIPVLYNASVYRDEKGKVVGVFAAARDITERKRAEAALREVNQTLERRVAERTAELSESEARFRRLVEQVSIPLCLVNNKGAIVYFNDRFVRIFGYTRDELPTLKEWWQLAHPDEEYRRWVVATWEAAAGRAAEEKADIQPVEYNVTCKNGAVRVVEISGITIEDGFLATFIDITERKRGEEELQAARDSAEKAKTVAEQANRAKDHFLAVLSHELRTPLTPVVMGISMLQGRPDLDVKAREMLEMVRRNVEMEARLIDDLLDVSRIARGKLELTRSPVELCAIINRAVEVCKPDIEARRLHFGLDLGPCAPYWVEADVPRLQQVFWNLLKNAIKFTPHGGRVGIRCRPDDGHVLVEVNDTGIGIEPEMLSRVFNAFEQAERSITRQFGGLGLGLTISKALVEMHGGTIEAFSEGRDKGATFRVRLPLTAPAGQPEVSPRATPPHRAPRPLHILLVEDHGVTAQMMRTVLTAEGHTVETAGDVATALELAGQHDFDLLLSDLGLPDGSGHDLMRQLRARGFRFPGIALSGYGQEEDIRRSRETGFAAHLTKPASREAVVEAVASIAAGQSMASSDESAPTQQPDAAVFDAQTALKRCLGKQDLLAQMIRFFFDDVDKLWPQIQAALQRGDLPEVGNLGHRLKGTISHLAAEPARKAALRVERIGLCGGEQAAAEEAVGMLEQECQVLKAALAEYLSAAEGKQGG